MSIKLAIFAVESMAHLQGREKTLLPLADAARAELAEIKAALELAEGALPSGSIKHMVWELLQKLG